MPEPVFGRADPRPKGNLLTRGAAHFTIDAMKQLVMLPVALFLVSTWSLAALGQKAAAPDRWEKDIAAYEAQDKANPPPKGGIVFIGSSTIRRWTTLAQDFPEHKVLNRGFGGSQIADAARYADRIVIPYAPQAVFLRAGSNDINAGKSPEQVFADFQAFVAKVHAALPETQIHYIALSPTIARWNNAEKEKRLNELVKAFAADKPNVKYADCYDISLGPDGKPRADVFVADKLHFNAEGNRLLAESIRPHLPKP